MDVLEQLKRDEGCRLTAYRDTMGFWTIGYGHKLLESEAEDGALTWTQDQADGQLASDLAVKSRQVAMNLPWTIALDEARLGVLENMAFNLGIAGLLGFHRTLAMVEAGNYEGAATAMLESKWAEEVGPRATRLANQMKTGLWDGDDQLTVSP